LFPRTCDNKAINYPTYVDLHMQSGFSFSRFVDLGVSEVEMLALGGLIYL
jgi:hypothetical protein